MGVAEGTVRDIAILSRVGKPVCFLVEGVMEGPEGPRLLLSRRRAQSLAREALMSRLRPGMVIPCTITHLEPFGAFVDIGCGVPSLIGIENISVSRIPTRASGSGWGRPSAPRCWILDPRLERIYLTHRELLGTWAENAARFQPGMTVPGIVRGVKDYGAFVELTPNLSAWRSGRRAWPRGSGFPCTSRPSCPSG